MKERPILFKGEMVKAILDGRKTQTRRICKPQPHPDFLKRGVVSIVPQWPMQDGMRWFMRDGMSELVKSPYGAPSDRLWVKETWRPDDYAPEDTIYAADIPEEILSEGKGIITWKPSIHMSRKRSRLNLEITGLRVERLQDITEHDAYCEGVQLTDDFTGCAEDLNGSYVTAYEYLWKQINGEKSWDENPWVWVIEFKRLRP